MTICKFTLILSSNYFFSWSIEDKEIIPHKYGNGHCLSLWFWSLHVKTARRFWKKPCLSRSSRNGVWSFRHARMSERNLHIVAIPVSPCLVKCSWNSQWAHILLLLLLKLILWWWRLLLLWWKLSCWSHSRHSHVDHCMYFFNKKNNSLYINIYSSKVKRSQTTKQLINRTLWTPKGMETCILTRDGLCERVWGQIYKLELHCAKWLTVIYVQSHYEDRTGYEYILSRTILIISLLILLRGGGGGGEDVKRLWGKTLGS